MVGGATSVRYVSIDHLGSVAVLTDESGTVMERDAYDPWGKRRNADGSDDAACALTSQTTRGYTGHEQLDSVCLINANARIYDPTLGQFMSADTVISDNTDSQDFNRYAYVENNPVTLTDPTGHETNDLKCSGGGEGCTKCTDGCSSESSKIPTVIVVGQRYVQPLRDLFTQVSIRNAITTLEGVFRTDFYGEGGREANGGEGQQPKKKDTNGKKSKPCSSGQRIGKAVLGGQAALEGAAVLGGAASFEYLGGTLFVGGCINPTPFEPATCALGTSALVMITPGAAGLATLGVQMYKKEVIPDLKAAASGMCTD